MRKLSFKIRSSVESGVCLRLDEFGSRIQRKEAQIGS